MLLKVGWDAVGFVSLGGIKKNGNAAEADVL